MTQSVERTAACSCGQLNIRTRGAPSIVSSCRCLECQRRTGSLFGAQVFLSARRNRRHRRRARQSYRRQADSGAWLAFHFCPECGSTVFWENERVTRHREHRDRRFADPQFPPPVGTVFTRSKHDWLGLLDIPHHPESPATLVPR